MRVCTYSSDTLLCLHFKIINYYKYNENDTLSNVVFFSFEVSVAVASINFSFVEIVENITGSRTKTRRKKLFLVL